MRNDRGSVGTQDGCLKVERGPDWLFVRLDGPHSAGGERRLSETILGMLRENMTNRVVLELESIEAIDDHMLDELSALGQRVRAEGGIVRACGLSNENLSRLESSAAADHVPHFRCRTDAVRAARTAVS